TIGIFAHLLARDADGPDDPAWCQRVREHVTGILSSVHEANRVIDELMRFGQDRLLNLYEQPLGPLVEECIAACRPRALARGIGLETLPGPEGVIVTDKHKITQALGNLLDTAVGASPAGGRVEVRWSLDGALVRIAIRDYGAGVPEEIRGRLFTPF